jgi:hypothetical protein
MLGMSDMGFMYCATLYLNAVVSQFAIIIEIELTIQHAAYYKLASYFLRMA